MTEISKSPERHTWRRNLYLQKLEEDPNDNDALLTVDFLESIRKQDSKKLEDPVWKENNLEYDLRTTDWILEKVRSREDYPQHVYAALCNMQWQKIDIIEILKDQPWSCSMRYAGGIVADMREEGDYIDWYNLGSGIGFSNWDIIEACKPLMREIGCDVRVEHLPERPFDVKSNVLDATKLQLHTGWISEVEFEDGLCRTRDWLMSI